MTSCTNSITGQLDGVLVFFDIHEKGMMFVEGHVREAFSGQASTLKLIVVRSLLTAIWLGGALRNVVLVNGIGELAKPF
jgi:hypothetical protein